MFNLAQRLLSLIYDFNLFLCIFEHAKIESYYKKQHEKCIYVMFIFRFLDYILHFINKVDTEWMYLIL